MPFDINTLWEMITPLREIATLVSFGSFLGIVWWAWSSKRQTANQESAELPFDIPDEFSKDES